MPTHSMFKSALVSRASEKRDQAKAKLRAWRLIRRQVMERDRYRCRACGKRATDAHHIRPRSLGGLHTSPNLAALCRADHDDIKLGRLFISGNAGDTGE